MYQRKVPRPDGSSLFMAEERSDGTQEEVVIEGGQLFFIMVSMPLIRYCPSQTGCLLLLHGSKGTAVASLMVLDLTPCSCFGILVCSCPTSCLELASVRNSLFRRKGKSPCFDMKGWPEALASKDFSHKWNNGCTVIQFLLRPGVNNLPSALLVCTRLP